MTFSYQLKGWAAHKKLLLLALPMILANSTTPLLGLVDTAVMGHMDSSAKLAGASIGALILTQIYWVSGFLRMSATGLSAQAKGNDSLTEVAKVFYQGCAVGLFLGLILLILQVPILTAGLWLTSPDLAVATNIDAYFSVRVWGAPGAMMNLGLIGWLVGQQKTRGVLLVQVVGNLVNVVLDVVLVLVFDYGVAGVAGASVAAEYTMLVMGLMIAHKHIGGIPIDVTWFNRAARKLLLQLNTNMFLRNLVLQICLAFLTIQGAHYGQTATAVNAILMQFFVLIALGLDGVAYAVEALVGEAAGAKKVAAIKQQTSRGLLWSSIMALVYSAIFLVFGGDIIGLLTDISSLQQAAKDYLYLMVLLPIMAHWCFLFDGVFVGLTRSAQMRNTMFISAVLVYFPVWWLTKSAGNEALWYALLAFLLARGVTLAWVFYQPMKSATIR